MLRHIAALPLLLIAFAVPAQAQAKHAAARLLACDVEGHSASFRGSMNVWKKGTTLEMRFALDSRSQVQTLWTHSQPPEGFDVWTRANPGVRRYVVDKTIKGLVAGSAYRAIIRFRWRDAKGRVVARAERRTKACRQPDRRANLLASAITIEPGADARTRTYTVRVENDGPTAAPAFMVGLQVNGQQLEPQSTEDPLAEDGGFVELEFTGPPCQAGSGAVATVDTEGIVDESDETDNTFTVPCV